MSNRGFVNKTRDLFDRTIGVTAQKIGNQRHLQALKEGMLFTLPFTLLGGLFMIIAFPPVPEGLRATNPFYSFLIMWQNWAQNSSTVILPYYLTIGAISIYVVVGISYNLAKHYKLNAAYTALMSLFIFLVIAAKPAASDSGMVISMQYLDANGMFTGIIVALVSVEICRFLFQRNIKFKMPSSVPPNITAPFDMIIPMIVNLLLFIVLDKVAEVVTGDGFVSLIQAAVSPLLTATDSLTSVILINLLVMCFWFFGIHGASMVASIIGPIQASNLVSNATAYANGEVLPYVLAGSVKSIFGTVIMYQALMIALLIFAKSTRLKSLSKISLIPNIFNINEPLLFGLPIVMNVTLIIPVFITVVFNTATFYILMDTGVIGKLFISLTPTIPGPINAYLSTMDWKAPILWLLLFIVNVALFAPFVKRYDKEVQLEDNESNENINKDDDSKPLKEQLN